jgi:hypothetical protein
VKAEQVRATEEPTAVSLDLDQADLAPGPTRTRVWAPVGVPSPVLTPGTNRKQPLFGAVTPRTGQTHVQLRPHKRSADFQAFVDTVLLPAYPDADFLVLLVDGAAIYTSKSTCAWLAQRPRVVLVALPTYAPELNLQELVWRWLRAEVTHNHYFGSFATLVAAAQRFFAKLAAQPEAVLRRIGQAFPNLIEHQLAANIP